MAADDLDWKAWILIATIIIALLIMAADLVGPDLVFTAVIGFFMAARILPVNAAGSNYGNTGLLTVIKLYIVAEGIFQTGGLEWVMNKVLGRSRSVFWALVRIMIPCIVLSAFLNNTPVVALLTPILLSWSKRSGVPAKKLLIPLSYAAVLGGTITLIGTSTNLVVAGAAQNRYKDSYSAMKLFDISPYGVPYALWGFIFVLSVQSFLLPGNNSKFAKDLLVALRVIHSSPPVGQTLLSAGLYKVHNSTLVALKRGKQFIRLPAPLTVVEEGDILYYAGELDNIIAAGEEHGLLIVSDDNEDSDAWRDAHTRIHLEVKKIIQATVKPGGALVSRRVPEADFQTKYDLSLVAVQRGRREDVPFSELVLQAGDVLLFEQGLAADPDSPEFLASFHNVHVVRESQVALFVGSFVVTTKDVAGKTITEAGLRGIPGIHVLALDPEGNPARRSSPADLTATLQVGDVLWLAADLSGFTFLIRFPGILVTQQSQIDQTGVRLIHQGLHQAVVAANSGLVGLSVSDYKFRLRYRAAVVAVQREGSPSLVDASRLVLQPGDVLLVNGDVDWAKDNKSNRNFVLVNSVADSSPPKRNRALLAGFLGLVMIMTQIIPGAANAKEWIHLWPSSILTGILMILTGCLNGDQARRSILWDVYLAIAAAFGVSNAMEATGVANEFAQLFIKIGEKVGTEGAALTAVYVATALLSELLTNNASGAIMFPIAAIAGDKLNVDPDKMAVAIMLGASAGFINPFSYQCNLMVYTAGNYRTLEFAKIGAPFQVYLLFVAAFILHLIDSWKQVWIVSFIVVAAYLAVPFSWGLLPIKFTEPIEKSVVRFASRLAFWRKKKALGRGDSQLAALDGGLKAVSRSSSFDDAAKK